MTRIDPDLISLRVMGGFGVVCGVASSGPQPMYTIGLESGRFSAEPADSALALAINGIGLADDEWRVLKVVGLNANEYSSSWDGTRSGGSKFKCDWGPRANPNLQLMVSGDTSGVQTGSVIRGFRQLDFGIFPWNGEWWFGRRLRGAGWEPMTGPLNAPADSGLVFTYLDRAGNVAVTPTGVAAVEILMRAPRGGQLGPVDSLRTTVALRGG